jgi:hypothetical protein
MKKLIILGALLLPSLIASCGIDPSVPSNLSAQDVDAEIRTATLDQLVERQGLYYEINSETPFMGLLRDVYPNGQKKREGNFVRGVLDGGMTAWYENGQKKYEGNFVNGKADGLVTIWYDNGQKNLKKSGSAGQAREKRVGTMTGTSCRGTAKNKSDKRCPLWVVVSGPTPSYQPNGRFRGQSRRQKGWKY